MRFSKLDLLTLLISLFVFASCEKTSTIGLEIDPNSAVQGTLVDTATITSRTVADSNYPTYGAGSAMVRYPFGYLNDGLIGETTASIAMSVNLPSNAYSFGDNAVLDSAVLVLSYAGEFYGDSTENYNVKVHTLTKDLSTYNSYLRDTVYAKNTLLANKSGKVYPTTPVTVMDVLTGATDTAKVHKAQMRIKLDASYITDNIVNVNASILKHNSLFRNSFKGLHLELANANNTAMSKGGMMFFDFSSTNSGLMLYYRKKNATTSTATDTVSVNFPIGTSNGPVAASIKHNHSLVVKKQLDSTTKQFEETFLQPLGGLRNKIAFPYLKNFKTNAGKIIVNKAELVIELKEGTDISPFKAAPRLALYRNDIAGQRINLQDNNVGSNYAAGDPRANASTFGGFFDSVNKRYVFTVTAYIQDLLEGKTVDNGTFLAVTPASSFEYATTLNTASRAVISSSKKFSAANNKPMKLNIYYTKID